MCEGCAHGFHPFWVERFSLDHVSFFLLLRETMSSRQCKSLSEILWEMRGVGITGFSGKDLDDTVVYEALELLDVSPLY